MADSYYCKLCKGRCDNCTTCLRTPGRVQLKPPTDTIKLTTDMIRTALEKKGAFTSSAFQTISKELPKISVEARADGGAEVVVRLTSIPFLKAYLDPESQERRNLEEAAREEIISAFKLPRDRVKDGDIVVDIREGSVIIRIILFMTVLAIADLSSIKTDSTYSARDRANDIITTLTGATGAAIGATAGSAAGPPGMALGAAIGFIGGTLFGKNVFK